MDNPVAASAHTDSPADSTHSHDYEDLLLRVSTGAWQVKTVVVLREEQDGALLFDPDTESLMAINVTGSALLRWSPTGITADSLASALCACYPKEDPQAVRKDVIAFLAYLSPFMEPMAP